MKQAMFAIIVALVFCGQLKAQELVSVTSMPEIGMIKYDLSAPKIPNCSDPFVSGDWQFDGDTWAKFAIESYDDLNYYFSITTFDSPISMYYDSFSKARNSKLKKLPYYNKKRGVCEFILAGGKMYHTGEFQFVLPGKEGNNIVRYEIFGDSIRIFVNLAKIPKGTSSPFAITSATSWWDNRIPIKIDPNGSGWGSFVISKVENDYEVAGNIGLGYGAIQDGNDVWPNIFDTDDKSYINPKEDGLMIPEQYRNK